LILGQESPTDWRWAEALRQAIQFGSHRYPLVRQIGVTLERGHVLIDRLTKRNGCGDKGARLLRVVVPIPGVADFVHCLFELIRVLLKVRSATLGLEPDTSLEAGRSLHAVVDDVGGFLNLGRRGFPDLGRCESGQQHCCDCYPRVFVHLFSLVVSLVRRQQCVA
jgi:hypothetical protein